MNRPILHTAIAAIALLYLCSFTAMASSSTKTTSYSYVEKDHSTLESAKIVSVLYGINWVTYYLTQPDEFREHGSFSNYKKNLKDFHFDKDAPFWNLIIHPYTGSQVYLFYRAYGYSNMGAFFMTLIQSTLFEFTMEVYTEPPSVQDLYQTPVFGSILGFGIEKLSMKLLNSGSAIGKITAHIINPATLFNFFPGIKATVVPTIKKNKPIGLSLLMEY